MVTNDNRDAIIEQMAQDVTQIKKIVMGNGHPENSLPSRLDRVERWVAGQTRLTWIIIGAVVVWVVRGVWVASVVAGN